MEVVTAGATCCGQVVADTVPKPIFTGQVLFLSPNRPVRAPGL